MVKLTSILLLILCIHASAQRAIQMPDPLEALSKQQKTTLKTQADSMYAAARPAVAKATKSTVIISYRGQHIAYGTVVRAPLSQKNVILTKWSEIAHSYKRLIVTNHEGRYNRAELVGVFPEHDLAALETELKLTPIDLKSSVTPKLGDIITLASPTGQPLSLGVVSVLERSLRETDKAYLGVHLDFNKTNQRGTPVEDVVNFSPAAKAGLRQGDIVTAIDQKPIKGSMELRNFLLQHVPGSEVLVSYRRGTEELSTRVRLGSRPRKADPRRIPRKRMDEMQRMGAVPNRVRHDFPSVIQSDIPIQNDLTPNDPRDNFTNECGGPVVNLDGKPVGIVIARGSRIKTFIIPMGTIQTLLQSGLPKLKYARNDRQPPRSALRKSPPRAIPLDE